MRLKRALVFLLLLFTFSSTTVFAMQPKSPILMGEILEVQKDDKTNTTRLLVEGYIKSCEVYNEKVLVIVGEDTKIMGGCDGKDGKPDFAKGDKVFVVLSSAMTKSIPPQSSAKKIQVSKPVK
ncbi:hypothetical protein [Clostridium hydrogeniformans]|uniref:hypothetical protein n=1 Tax=Clostridium hydrogeniformans TaxID=349933 RepID=UPI0004858A40|nr:hypothetical protein [Clostridium hydrogeniformans]